MNEDERIELGKARAEARAAIGAVDAEYPPNQFEGVEQTQAGRRLWDLIETADALLDDSRTWARTPLGLTATELAAELREHTPAVQSLVEVIRREYNPNDGFGLPRSEFESSGEW